MLIQRRRIPRPERDRTGRTDPYYGYGYRPDWPSILSIAHDESDGGRLLVITDRPCVLVPGPLALPLSVGSLPVLEAAQILPVKFRLTMGWAVPAGSAWHWGAGASSLIDPISNHAPNPASGSCADVPGPFVPPPPAVVTSASLDGTGLICTLIFDRPLVLAGDPPYGPLDSSIQFNDQAPVSVEHTAPDTLAFDMSDPLSSGASWNVNAQPAWVLSPIAVPQNGML